MGSDQIARIDWKMGQTLLPEHFFAQEASLVADTAIRFGLLGVPFYGIGRLRWSEALISDGILSIKSLTAVLLTGQVIQVPGNAQVQNFNLNLSGSTRVTVYLHVTSDRALQEGDGQDAASAPPGQEPIDRVVHRCVLSTEQVVKNGELTIKLAEFSKSLEGAWSLAEDYLPPLLQVGSSPFLAELLERLSRAIDLFHRKLGEDIAASYLGGEALSSAKVCLKGVYAIERLLSNLANQVHLHPYALYDALKTFYTELCIYQDATPEQIASPYLHDDLAGCLGAVTKPLFELLQTTRAKARYLSFEQGDGVFVLPQIPKEVRVAKAVYFLLQRPAVSDVLQIEGLKLASRGRLAIVHQHSLVGIPLKKIERPPFQHKFGAEVEFYLLSEGDEWDHALKEGTIAFYASPALAKVRAYVYWRSS